MRLNVFNPNTQKKVVMSEYKKSGGDYTLIIGGVVVVIVLIIGFIVYNSIKYSKCISLEDKAVRLATEYAENNELLPKYNGTFVTINLDQIENSNLSLNGNKCTGTVKITKVDDKYVKTFDLQNCNYCTTSKHYSWSSWASTYPKGKKLIDVTATFNYYNSDKYYTFWSDWFASEEINPEVSEYGINLPILLNELPKVPTNGKLIKYELENKTFYSTRDKKWKFYSYKNNNYSGFYSEKPNGYAYRDDETRIETEPTSWSPNYPDVKDYRRISSTKGFRWYYMDGDKKVYYHDGEYSPVILDDEDKEKYNKKDSDSINMYRYVDALWRWYNGIARDYSGYMSLPTTTYKYKDTEIYNYTTWNSWSPISTLTSVNKVYREQKTNIHSRYRAYYSIDSFEVFDKYLNQSEFESKTAKTVEEMMDNDKVVVNVKYTYKYGK